MLPMLLLMAMLLSVGGDGNVCRRLSLIKFVSETVECGLSCFYCCFYLFFSLFSFFFQFDCNLKIYFVCLPHAQ